MSFAINLKFLREELGLSQEQLADKLEIPRSTLTHYESVQNDRLPRYERLQKIANFFAVTVDELLGADLTVKNRITISKSAINLPMIGTIGAGLPILAEENIEGYIEILDYLRADYVLQFKGDSMIGVGMLDGDLAICRETTVPLSGQIIVALRDKGSISEATLKFYMDENGQPSLRAANPAFADIDYTNEYRTAGIMVALVREEAPGYQIYKNYISVPGYDDWTEVIDKATGAGIKPEHLKSHVDMLIEMGKKR